MGWPVVPLSDVAHVSVGLSAARKRKGEPLRPVRLVSVGDLTQGAVPPLDALPVAEVGVNPSAFTVRNGDVLLTARGTQHKVALVGAESAGAVANATLFIVRPSPALRSHVLYAIARSVPFQERLSRLTRASTTIFGLSVRDVEMIPVPMPPLAEQDEFVALYLAAERHHRLAMAVAERRRRVLGVVSDTWLYAGPFPRETA